VNILKDLNKSYVRCPHCGKMIKNEGKLLNGKYYHDVCADKIALTMACREDGEPKKIYIAV
jgi:translation initiation factor 2 beta subunit (eIF-2beta)/eIF-5